MVNGILNIYKEAGYTSHDVVARLRGIFRQQRVGHTGTLDPEAEGVLPVCLGRATAACAFLENWDKTYRCVMRLGITTDTQDMTGRVLRESEVSQTEQEIVSVAMGFVGAYDQIPPMYSAVKVNGKKLYELARAGKEVERKPRRVEIRDIRVERVDLPLVSMEVICGKGTYIRTLCHDIGERLGCGACMEHLVRTRVGDFSVEASKTLAQVERFVLEGNGDALVQGVDAAFLQYPMAFADESLQKLLVNGNRIPASGLDQWEPGWEGTPLRVYDSRGIFVGLYQYEAGTDGLKPLRIFYDVEAYWEGRA